MNRYFVIEGPDGSGKSTQTRNVVERLRLLGIDAHPTYEPGGTPLGDKIRQMVKYPEDDEKTDALTSLFLFNAGRSHLLKNMVSPRCAEGWVMVSDRCFFSSIAYQAFAGGLNVDDVRRMCEVAVGNHLPQQVFYLNVSLQVAKQRMEDQRAAREEERKAGDFFDGQNDEYHKKVIEGYDYACHRYRNLVTLVKGERTPDEIADEITNRIVELLG